MVGRFRSTGVRTFTESLAGAPRAGKKPSPRRPARLGANVEWPPIGNPCGKPRGTRHRLTLLAERIMHDDAEDVVQAVLTAAKGGDMVGVRSGRDVADFRGAGVSLIVRITDHLVGQIPRNLVFIPYLEALTGDCRGSGTACDYHLPERGIQPVLWEIPSGQDSLCGASVTTFWDALPSTCLPADRVYGGRLQQRRLRNGERAPQCSSPLVCPEPGPGLCNAVRRTTTKEVKGQSLMFTRRTDSCSSEGGLACGENRQRCGPVRSSSGPVPQSNRSVGGACSAGGRRTLRTGRVVPSLRPL